MYKKLLLTLITSMFMFSSTLSFADEGKRYDKSVTWKNVVKINFKPGKRGAALKIIKDYYVVATSKAKTAAPEMTLELYTGEFDLLVIWHMKGGVSDMTWEEHPDDSKWRSALNDVAGGEEKAQDILDNFSSYIDNSTSDIALTR